MKDILDLEVRPGPDTYTIRSYLMTLLKSLWEEGENFSSKRPLGDSDWKRCVDEKLALEGHVDGTFDEDGDLVDADYRASDEIIQKCIHYLFKGEHNE